MPQIELNLEAFSEYSVVVGAGTDDYAQHVASCAFVPDGGTIVRWKGGTPTARKSHIVNANWTAVMRVGQDFTATGLARFYHDHEGELVPHAFTHVATGQTVYASVHVAAGQIGGDIDTFGEATITHAVEGKPSFTAPE